MSDEAVGSAQQLKVRGTRWEAMQLGVVEQFLQTAAVVLASDHAKEAVLIVKQIAADAAMPVESCPTCVHIESKYPVLCESCAPIAGRTSPQKMIFCIRDGSLQPAEDGGPLWVAAFMGIGFVPQKLNRPNSLAGAEGLLDELADEEAVKQMQALVDVPVGGSSGSLLPN